MADEESRSTGASPAGRPPGGSGGKRAARIVAAVAGVAVVGAGIWFGVAGGGGSSAPPPSSSPPSPAVNPLTGEGPGGHVIAVKIDNVGDAQRMQAGLNSADLVYVIQVEGGLSRYLVVFDSSGAPARVGPVRSARQTDIPLLAPYGRIGLVYSGAISGLLPDLAAANLQTITPSNSNVFSNGGSSPTFVRPAQVFAAFPNLAQTKDVGFRFGPEPAGGTQASSASAKMPAARFTFTASGAKWLVAVDGHAVVTTDAGQANAVNVIIQHVKVVPGKYTDHNAGHADNEVFSQTTGQGSADFYRDGKVWHGQWSKPTDGSPTSYTVNGAPMNLGPGRTWIVLEG